MPPAVLGRLDDTLVVEWDWGRDFIVDVPGEFGEIGGSGSILTGTVFSDRVLVENIGEKYTWMRSALGPLATDELILMILRVEF